MAVTLKRRMYKAHRIRIYIHGRASKGIVMLLLAILQKKKTKINNY